MYSPCTPQPQTTGPTQRSSTSVRSNHMRFSGPTGSSARFRSAGSVARKANRFATVPKPLQVERPHGRAEGRNARRLEQPYLLRPDDDLLLLEPLLKLLAVFLPPR